LACLLFQRLELPLGWKIPVTLIAVNFLWSSAKAENLETFPSIMGIIGGFVLYPQAWLYLCTTLGVDA